MGEYDRAIAAGQQALALATTSGTLDVLVPAHTVLAHAYLHMGNFREALDMARRAMALLTGNLRYAHFGRLAPPGVTSRFYVAICLAELGEMTEGRGVGEDAVRLAEELEHPYSIAVALWHVGWLYLRQGDVHTAISVHERGLALCQSANNPLNATPLAASLGAAYALAGRAAEAHPLLDQTLERLATGSHMVAHALVLTEVSEALLLVSRVEDAGTLASRLLELSRTHRGHGYQAHAFRLLGDVARRREPPDVDQAAAHYRQALTLAEELGMRPLQAHCHLGLGMLLAKTGRAEHARSELATAIEMYQSMEMRFWLSQAEAALAQMEG
jgi:tetratricopeptide (TPR) repeat protein